ncbi:hypothetical protein R6Q59_016632 [Mikania micrantha]
MVVPRKLRKTSDDRMSVSRHGVGKPIHQSTTTIQSLPRDLLVDVLARVASSSFTDLFTVKLSCKNFLELAKDDYVSQCISIDTFPVTHWFPPSTKQLSFLTHSLNKGNSESLFRQGMIEYFNLVNEESGLKYLKRAVEKRHLEATYVYGMTLLSSEDQLSQQQGLDILNSTNRSTSMHWNVKDSRDKIEWVLSQMWINNPVTLQKVNTKCHERDHAIRFRRRGWNLDDDKQLSSCDTCLWYRELISFCKMMNVIV